MRPSAVSVGVAVGLPFGEAAETNATRYSIELQSLSTSGRRRMLRDFRKGSQWFVVVTSCPEEVPIQRTLIRIMPT